MIETATASVIVRKIDAGKISSHDDFLACEEPLEIQLVFGSKEKRIKKNISVTMRTPGNDTELAVGFLFTEGIISSPNELKSIPVAIENSIIVELDELVIPAIQKLERNFYTTSSCGVCGKSSIDAIKTVTFSANETDEILVPAETIYSLPSLLRKTQDIFEQTGGLHASAIFDLSGNLLLMREDVGRHNALDKLIGAFFLDGSLPLKNRLLLLSGRASFELIQKAVMAGIKLVAAVGAPSSLAVEMAREFDITLIGFLRDKRFNIYSGEKRIATG
ncbi:formate dehydrogenase accessory sulfurtransferase FdhD [soil metagenome]